MEEFKLNKKNYKKGDACCSVYNEEEYPKICKCISYDELVNLIDIKDNLDKNAYKKFKNLKKMFLKQIAYYNRRCFYFWWSFIK